MDHLDTMTLCPSCQSSPCNGDCPRVWRPKWGRRGFLAMLGLAPLVAKMAEPIVPMKRWTVKYNGTIYVMSDRSIRMIDDVPVPCFTTLSDALDHAGPDAT